MTQRRAECVGGPMDGELYAIVGTELRYPLPSTHRYLEPHPEPHMLPHFPVGRYELWRRADGTWVYWHIDHGS